MDYLLIDVFDNNAYDFIVPGAGHRLIPVRPPRLFKGKKQQWLTGVLKVLFQSRKGDRILFLYDFQAVLAWWFCRFTGMKREFFCLNLLLDQSGSFRNRLVSKLYCKALQDKHFYATVTSVSYGQWLNAALGTDAKFELLRDVYHASYAVSPGSCSSDVFCGGRNGRDWDFYFELASSMPDVSFVAVMPSDFRSRYEGRKPENMQLFFDMPEETFGATMAASSVVCLPLTKQAPAGLIVLFQAAGNRKPVIMSDTVTTQAYGSHGRGILLGKELTEWQRAIRDCLKSRDKAQEMALRLLAFCETECSEAQFVGVIDEMLSRNENSSL